MTQEKKAVFFDIDGTLINIMKGQTQIAPAVKKAIRALRAAAHALRGTLMERERQSARDTRLVTALCFSLSLLVTILLI